MRAFYSICIVLSFFAAKGQSKIDSSLWYQNALFETKKDTSKLKLLKQSARFYLSVDSLKTAQELLLEAYYLKENNLLLNNLLKIQSITKDRNLHQQLHTILLNVDIETISNKTHLLASLFYLNNQQLRYADRFIRPLEQKNLLSQGFLADSSSIKYKSIKKAKRLNAILPGLGVGYAGKPHIGFLNLVFVSGASYFTYYQVKNENYFTATLTGIGVFSRFYLGGISFAETAALNHNKKKLLDYCLVKIIDLNNLILD